MKQLSERTEVKVRFGEVDSMRIVWHGHYLKYFEDAREAFGDRYGLGYLDVYKHNVMIPIVKVDCDFKKPLKYGDAAIVEATYIHTEAAKIVFEYKIFRKSDMEHSLLPACLAPEVQYLMLLNGIQIKHTE